MFDYKKGYEEAKKKLESKKEEFEQAILILEEIIEENKVSQTLENQKTEIFDLETKNKRKKQAESELEEVLTRRKKKDTVSRDQQKYTSKKNNKAHHDPLNEIKGKIRITVQDLSSWAKRT